MKCIYCGSDSVIKKIDALVEYNLNDYAEEVSHDTSEFDCLGFECFECGHGYLDSEIQTIANYNRLMTQVKEYHEEKTKDER